METYLGKRIYDSSKIAWLGTLCYCQKYFRNRPRAALVHEKHRLDILRSSLERDGIQAIKVDLIHRQVRFILDGISYVELF